MAGEYIRWFEELRMTDVDSVGGKNASLGEMISQLSHAGVRVPGGFATTALAFRDFLKEGDLEGRIQASLNSLNVEDVNALAQAGKQIRQWVLDAPLPKKLLDEIASAYQKLAVGSEDSPSVAVRSSATAEDLPDASFAGQQETFLNISGLDNVIEAVKHVFASLYNDRAISYRVHQGFSHAEVALSAGIQRMARSDKGASGVLFTMDTESGFDQVVLITASWGLGESVVQGAVNPDEYYVSKLALTEKKPAVLMRNLGSKATKMIYSSDKTAGKTVTTVETPESDRNSFCLNNEELEELARYAMIIEKHYQRPMDVEWAKDGIDGKLYILQARPETVASRKNADTLERYQLKQKGEVLVTGRAIGQKIGAGKVKIIFDVSEMDKVQPGDVLVTDMTDPNWEPIMKRASAIVTNRGGRTCHAAIIARELGIPAVVGCENATDVLKTVSEVTVSCAEGETGHIYKGILDFEVNSVTLDSMPDIPVKITMNVGNPQLAFAFQRLPNEGVGLARLEFIISAMIGVHPRACLDYPNLPGDLKREVEEKSRGYASPSHFYREKLTEGIATLAAAFWPKKVIVRLSDFKSNEYTNLIGGKQYEPHEENPMLGFRGAARYISSSFKECFELECQALKHVRDVMGFTNVEIMVPFVRSLAEADRTLALLGELGLKRGENSLRIVMMCEIPANAILADQFLERFDGFSIGSNDLTQMTLAVDRDSGLVAHAFDERDPAVKAMLHLAISACRRANKYVGICGQGPSDHPDLAKWLMAEGIESMSLNPDSVISTWLFLAKQA
ncbi:phosphoenolpyruvate synthase [Ferrovum sp. PN-J185]|uniref:phosphoenolpyruvate synthase n=1 Tax=Ferrovum sp. PN-J185 TaxID=1356306 RepID=UPI00079669CF|nr:phosphoenolpyruvate synthase [Ferrovum sp. PN-J185]KXW56321.1 phosphoenolpyruvate synthase [Ferrovum sp. PN-J185]MCC6069045.1 phosphoenolpyruvate synthase [Ferrovum sp. PN-J185]MDE1890975.1 phosphoenolpyruvate synthase [Betaproteobacteria bacterium]MDE2055713.1 phosphoenolpyruvate synthase [Betaproteobacteria bacterium]